MRKIIVASGVTSNLFRSLLPIINDKYIIVGLRLPEASTEHHEWLHQHYVNIVITNDIHQAVLDAQEDDTRILWLSTHSDVPLLKSISLNHPTLAIGSGAALDFINGNMDLTKQTKETVQYVQDKVVTMFLPQVYTLIPGFYLEDMGAKTGGLHRTTTTKLMQPTFDPDFNWGKAKFVTPKSLVVQTITTWLAISDPPRSSWNRIGTQGTYNRWEIRDILYEDVPQSIKNKYESTKEPEEVTDLLKETCERMINFHK